MREMLERRKKQEMAKQMQEQREFVAHQRELVNTFLKGLQMHAELKRPITIGFSDVIVTIAAKPQQPTDSSQVETKNSELTDESGTK